MKGFGLNRQEIKTSNLREVTASKQDTRLLKTKTTLFTSLILNIEMIRLASTPLQGLPSAKGPNARLSLIGTCQRVITELLTPIIVATLLSTLALTFWVLLNVKMCGSCLEMRSFLKINSKRL